MTMTKIGGDPCPFGPVVELLFGRWTSHILWALNEHGRLRFTELRSLLPAVTPKVLTERLRKLERDGLITRSYYAEVPPRVEYEATELAATLLPTFRHLTEWAAEHLAQVQSAQQRYDAAAGTFHESA